MPWDFTGGSTGLKLLAERIAAWFPAAKVVRGDRFASVAQGLGVHARRAFGAGGCPDQPIPKAGPAPVVRPVGWANGAGRQGLVAARSDRPTVARPFKSLWARCVGVLHEPLPLSDTFELWPGLRFVLSQFGRSGWPSTLSATSRYHHWSYLMNTTKFFISTVTAVSIAGALGLAYAQTSTSPATTPRVESTMQNQPAVRTDGTMNRNADGTLNNNNRPTDGSMTRNADGTLNNNSNSTDNNGMTTERRARADRN